MSKSTRRSSWLLLLVGAVSVAGLAVETSAQDRPSAPPATDAAETAQPLAGVVQAFNLGPRGTAEGLLVQSSGKLLQVNFPPDLGGYVMQVAAVGDSIGMTAYTRDGGADHAVFELASLTGARGQVLKVSRPEDARALHVEGKIASLNYGRRGEVNGAILDTGDFVHFGPNAALTLGIAIGQPLTADGMGTPMLLGGHNVVDADSVNGVTIRRGPPPPRPGDRPPAPRPGDEPPPPPR